jgi:hypothetical protein
VTVTRWWRHVVAAVAGILVLTAAPVAWAAWSDTSTATTGTFTSGAVATPSAPTVTQQPTTGAGAVTYAPVKVGASATASSYDVLRYSSTASTASPVATPCAAVTALSCTDAKPTAAATLYYAVRARFGGSWTREGPRSTYVPDVTAPTITMVAPTNGSRTLGSSISASCNGAMACGTLSTAGTVTYYLTRGGAQSAACWTGTAWSTTATQADCTKQVAATGSTFAWSVPGTASNTTYPFSLLGTNTYTLVVSASDVYANTSAPMTVSFST